MDSYLLLKSIHIAAAVVLVGTGLGIAFFLYKVVRSDNADAILVTTRHVVLADWCFTAPALIISPVTGLLLMRELGFRFDSGWFYWVAGLYLLAGACWLPVVFIQYRMQRLAAAHGDGSVRRLLFRSLIKAWIALGIPAFGALVALYWLMIYKPWL